MNEAITRRRLLSGLSASLGLIFADRFSPAELLATPN